MPSDKLFLAPFNRIVLSPPFILDNFPSFIKPYFEEGYEIQGDFISTIKHSHVTPTPQPPGSDGEEGRPILNTFKF